MSRTKVVSDECVIAALLSTPTLDAAAQQCGLSVRQLYTRRQNPDFIRKLREAQGDALEGAVRYLQHSTATAASALVEICENGQEQNRLTAARTLLDQAAKLTEVVDFSRRLEALERMEAEGDDAP
ncbi:hypothetical protein B5F12_09140 [Pseudoflavonifractor sp. An176]|uniref:hypothetical protein n=1 Tax=Pseudoflavonifractor sp. An176 TaxID=1965572 RepID=UPI000B36F566|nr:hypothetical protein [Pseudoflavonifractor sp. An176]OUP62924.1 hypothetical protein B5F12_09140 [Pseudoflavonifractor sp. An176]